MELFFSGVPRAPISMLINCYKKSSSFIFSSLRSYYHRLLWPSRSSRLDWAAWFFWLSDPFENFPNSCHSLLNQDIAIIRCQQTLNQNNNKSTRLYLCEGQISRRRHKYISLNSIDWKDITFKRVKWLSSCYLEFPVDGKDTIHEELKDLNCSQTKPEAHWSSHLRFMF